MPGFPSLLPVRNKTEHAPGKLHSCVPRLFVQNPRCNRLPLVFYICTGFLPSVSVPVLLPCSRVFNTGSAFLWTHPYWQILHTLERGQWSTTKMSKGLRHLSYEERLRSIINNTSLMDHQWTSEGGLKKIQPGFCQWCPATRQAVDTTWTQKGLAEHQETLFLWVLSSTSTGWTERL